jgi:hypothetical protein
VIIKFKFIKMNKEQILGLVRHILTFAGGVAVAKGLIEDIQVSELVGAIIALVGSVWSVLSKKTV